MKKDELREEVLFLLRRDKEISKEIIRIVSENQNNLQLVRNKTDSHELDIIKSENSELKKSLELNIRKINVIQNEIECYKKSVEEKEVALTNLFEENSKMNMKLDELNNQLKILSKYKEIENIYSSFCSLNKQITCALANTISTKDVNAFIVSGSQIENIKTLWEFIKHQLDNISSNEIRILKDTFEYFFNAYNRYKKIYSMLEVKTGEEFDSDYHSKGSNSKSAGIISEVLLQGFKNDITGVIETKSVVRV